MRIRRRTLLGCGACALAAALAALAIPPVRRLFNPLVVRVRGPYTIEDRLAEFSDARARVRAQFDRAGVSYPPARVVLLGLKEEKQVDVYAAGARTGGFVRVASYP